jgi:PAS domain S-box-containing protein
LRRARNALRCAVGIIDGAPGDRVLDAIDRSALFSESDRSLRDANSSCRRWPFANGSTTRIAMPIQATADREATRREEARAPAPRGLPEHEALLRAIVETSPDGLITIDEAGVIQSFNPAAERMFGHRAEEVIGQKVACLMPPPYCEEHDGYIARYLRTGEKRIIGIGREVLGLRGTARFSRPSSRWARWRQRAGAFSRASCATSALGS